MRKNLPFLVAVIALAAIFLFVFTFDFGAWTRTAPQFDPIKTQGEPQAPVTLIEISDFQ